MRPVLRESIISCYDQIMNDYLGSLDHKQALWEMNKAYLLFRNKLPEDMQKELDGIVNGYSKIEEMVSEESFYRGFISGVACHDDVI